MATWGATAGMLSLAALMLSGMGGTTEGQTRAGVQNTLWPPVTRTAKPWTRWWWLGSAVDKPNLTRLLETYRQAGLGGVEVTCIYGVKGQDANELAYLSPNWTEMLAHTCTEAKRLEMGVDLPPGSGWRIGGPTVPVGLASATLVIETHAVKGNEALHLPFGGARPQAIVAYGSGGRVVALTEKLDAMGNLDWTVPTGEWTVYVVTQRFSGSKVKRPGPGGGGNSINPFSQKSLEAGLSPFSTLFSKLPTGGIRAQFHDSYEYEGNWTQEVFPEFLARCGYDLRDHLPALIGKGDAEEGERVRNDYRHLMGELFLDRVITPWVEQAHREGQLARNQAHGSPGNLLDLYAAADIPETEVFGADRAPLLAMFASSAGHVAGRQLVSSETGTWLAEHFTETLAEMKAETDMLFCAGINHIFYHGTAYSPANAAWPGWLFYASTEMNPNNPIWHDVPALNTYITRCQSLLQSGEPDSDVLLYWPERDVWQGDATHLIKQLAVHKRDWFEKEPFGQVAQTLVAKGYATDYISDRQIATAKTEASGHLRLPGGSYRVLLVPSCKFMPLATLENLVRLANEGATVLFQKGFPGDLPGWGNTPKQRERFYTLLKGLQSHPLSTSELNALSLHPYEVGKGSVWIGDDVRAMLEKAGVRRERLADTPGLSFIRRTDSNGAFYFVANRGTVPVAQWIPLTVTDRNVQVLDPLTGAVGRAATRKNAQAETEVFLALQPGETVFLCTAATFPAGLPDWRYWQAAGEKHDLRGEWQVEFIEGGPELPFSYKTQQLATWTKQGGEKAERFAGTARYTLRFDRPANVSRGWLDLGAVCQSARVRLNGKPLETLLAAPYRVLAEDLKPTDNLLVIEVTGVAANRIRDLDRRGVNWKIFKDINFVNINYKPFNAADWPLTDCGLLGPVTLQPVERKFP